jgi:hypothetical protein
MKAHRFRSPEEWKSALMTLPDKVYFELMRSVFGAIKTPFSKHRLMEDLSAFLTRGEIQEIIGAYIDGTDRRVLTAIAALEEPGQGDLENFFAGEYSYIELQGILLNLEERLILYRFREDDRYRLALNPLLEPVLAPLITDISALFPSFAPDASPGEAEGGSSPENGGPSGAWSFADDRTLAALFAFVTGEGDFFKAEGGIRKKVLEEGSRLFPGADMETLTGGLERLGLIRRTGPRYQRDPGRLGFFGDMPARERLVYWAAGIGLHMRGRAEPEAGAAYYNRNRLRSRSRFIHRLLGVLEPGRLYPRETLRRLAEMLEREIAGAGFVWGDDPGPAQSLRTAAGFEPLLASLEMTGLLSSPGGDLWSAGGTGRTVDHPDRPPDRAAGGAAGKAADSGGPAPVIAMDTAFSCILYPGIDFADALALASFCAVRETGVVVRFELTRDSVTRGFDQGLSAGAMFSLLERLSGNQVDQNLGWTLRDWEKRYSAVSLHRGVVLSLAEDRRSLADGGGPLAPLIARTLAPGVYLLSVTEQDEAVQELLKAGVDIIAQPPLPGGEAAGAPPGDFSGRPFPSLGELPRLYPGPWGEVVWSPALQAEDRGGPRGKPRETAAAAFQERFRAALAKLSLPPPEREELAARIERRLIVSESQLAGGLVRSEKTEARNLDYVGKTAIAKQAIAAKSLLEVLWFAPGGELNRVMGIPQGLEKWQGETALVLRPVTREPSLPTPKKPGFQKSEGFQKPEGLQEPVGLQEPLRIPLGKISLLRRIKQSIFGE